MTNYTPNLQLKQNQCHGKPNNPKKRNTKNLFIKHEIL